MSEDRQLIERTNLALEQWPHLACTTQHEHTEQCRGSAYGCMNCNLIFARPERVAMIGDTVGRCPKCGSESVFDVAGALSLERTALPTLSSFMHSAVDSVEELIKRIDAQLEEPEAGNSQPIPAH